MNSTRRGRQTTGSEAYRGSEGSQHSATDYRAHSPWQAVHACPALGSLPNKWQRWSWSQNIPDTPHASQHTCACAHMLVSTLLTGWCWLKTWWMLLTFTVTCALTSPLHLLSPSGHHLRTSLYKIFTHTFNLLPARFHVTCSDLFIYFTAGFISDHILLYTLNLPYLMAARYRGRF